METIIILLIILCCLFLLVGAYLYNKNPRTCDAFSLQYPTLNPQMSNPISNPALNAQISNPALNAPISNPALNAPISNPVLNPQMSNPMLNPVLNPQMSNPQMLNPQISNPTLNTQMLNPQMSNPETTLTSNINSAMQHYYNISNSNGYWDGNSAGVYTCPNAQNVNTTGGNGNWKNYCVFNSVKDVQNYCNSSPSCLGYVTNGSNIFQATNNPVKDPNGGAYYKKIKGNKPNYLYNEKFKSGWWDGNKSGVYTCPGATNRNSTDGGGNWDNYCIFNTAKDAENYCDTDPSCLGYVTNGTNLFQATNNPVPSNEGGAYYQKQ